MALAIGRAELLGGIPVRFDSLALAAAAKLEKQDAPQREADRQKKEIDDLELTREKNQKSFRP